jgi:hypothetical protein
MFLDELRDGRIDYVIVDSAGSTVHRKIVSNIHMSTLLTLKENEGWMLDVSSSDNIKTYQMTEQGKNSLNFMKR